MAIVAAEAIVSNPKLPVRGVIKPTLSWVIFLSFRNDFVNVH